MVQPENSPLPGGMEETFEGLSPPKVPSVKPREFLSEFREMLRVELMDGTRGLAREPARNVTHAVSKLVRFLAEERALVYAPAREAAACRALQDGVLLSDTPAQAEGSYLQLVLRSGRAGAQSFIDRLSADSAISTKSVESTVSRLRVFLSVAENAGWIEADGARLKNPRALKIDWDEFPPCKNWRLRSQGEIARQEKSRGYVLNQISTIHSFLEETRRRFQLSFDPARERKTWEDLRTENQTLAKSENPPQSLIEALLLHGEKLVQDFLAKSPNDNRRSALRSFYAELRDKLPGVFPNSLIEALKLPTVTSNARLPFFERFIEEHHHGGTSKVVRKDLRVFGHFVASRHGVNLIGSDEKIEWRLSPEGKLMFASWGQIGPVTEALRVGAKEELSRFRDYLRSRSDLRPVYQRDLFNAAKRFLQWASEERLVDDTLESIASLTFEIRRGDSGAGVRPRVKRRASKEIRDDGGVPAAIRSRDDKSGESRSTTAVHRSVVLSEQERLVRKLIDDPPTSIALGDLLMAHTRDFDSRRGAVTTRTAQRSKFTTLEPELAKAIESHLDRLRRSSLNRTAGKDYDGPIFVDSRGEGILSCNVPAISRAIDLSRVQLGLSVAHAIYREVRDQLAMKISLTDVLRLDLDDVAVSRTTVTLRDAVGDIIGKADISPPTAAKLRTFIEIIRASELGSLWASFNSQKPLFMGPEGYPLVDSLPGLAES